MSELKQDNGLLSLDGDLSIQVVNEQLSRLLVWYKDGLDLSIDVSGLREVDLTGVQVLEAVRRTAGSDGRRVRLTAPAKGALLEVLQRGGFLSDAAARAFWLQEAA